MKRILLILLALCLFLASCNHTPIDTDSSIDTEADTNTDTNTDTDTSIDTNTDTDTDTNTDTDTDTDSNKVQAPNITVLDYNGNEVTLDSLKGKPIVLNFWASWCPPCRAEMPDLEEAYKQYGDEVLFVMVSHLAWGDDTISSAKAFYEQSGYTFPIYFDYKYEGYYEYGLNSIPQTYFIDKNGYIQSYVPHMITKDELFEAIEAIK